MSGSGNFTSFLKPYASTFAFFQSFSSVNDGAFRTEQGKANCMWGKPTVYTSRGSEPASSCKILLSEDPFFKMWGWNGQKRRCCVDGRLKRRTKRRLQKHPDTSGWGLNLKAGREAIAPSVPSFPSFSSNGYDFRRPLSPSHARSPSSASLGGCSWRPQRGILCTLVALSGPSYDGKDGPRPKRIPRIPL